MTELATTSPELSAARALVPQFDGERDSGAMGEYLAFRLVGFSVTEALRLVNRKEKTLKNWRLHKDGFRTAELECMGNNRGKLRKELLDTMFTRNFMLTMRQDQEILFKAAGLVTEEIHYTDPDTGKDAVVEVVAQLDDDERAYWMQMRRQYTPAQLEAINKLFEGRGGDVSDIHTLIFQMSKTEQHIHAS